MYYRTYKVARDARTGRFVPLWYAERHPATTVVETRRISSRRNSRRRGQR